MKKFFLLFSFLSIMALPNVFAANANSDYGTEVEIPFAFVVGERSYDAGKFIVKVGRVDASIATITIQDTRNDRSQIVLARRSGDSPAGDFNLVFERSGDVRVLAKIVTPNGGYAVNRRTSPRNTGVASVERPSAIVEVSDLF